MIVGATTWLGTTWDLMYKTLPRPTYMLTFVQVRGCVRETPTRQRLDKVDGVLNGYFSQLAHFS